MPKLVSLAKYWVPVVAWMLLLFLASGDMMSSEHTSRFLVPFLRWLVPDISPATIDLIHLLVRKCAHLGGYAILAALLWRAFDISQRGIWRSAAISFVIAAVYASLDEFHQSFISSRTASSWDVLIDCTGAAVSLALCLTFQRKKRGRVISDF
jgi:VanZ family protein